MGMNLVDIHDNLKLRRTAELWDDFHWYISPHLWTSLASDSGVTAPAATDASCGILSMATGATDNNEVDIATTKAIFLMAANKPMLAEAYIQYSEANTSAANVAFGFADSFGANLLVDDGAGPKTSFSGALIYKVDGGTAWKCVSSKSTTQTISTSTITAGGSSYQKLRIEIRPSQSGSVAEVTFWVNDQQLLDSAVSKPTPIKHNVTYTSAAQMQLGLYIKAGSANSETLLCDYIGAELLR